MTLDTHAPSGTPNPKCLKQIMNMRNLNNWTIKESFKCTSKYVKNFINEFNNLNLEDTKLILIGDHLLMQDITNDKRFIYNKFFIEDEFTFKRDYMNFFDIYPSILELMKFNINNKYGKVGLGYSIFKKNEEYEILNFPFNGTSKLYDTFWQVKTK